MEIRCPACHFRIVVKGLKPGGYHPLCSQCEQRFFMVVALVDGHRLVLLGETMETLTPVHGLDRLRAPAAHPAIDAGAADGGALAPRPPKRSAALAADEPVTLARAGVDEPATVPGRAAVTPAVRPSADDAPSHDGDLDGDGLDEGEGLDPSFEAIADELAERVEATVTDPDPRESPTVDAHRPRAPARGPSAAAAASVARPAPRPAAAPPPATPPSATSAAPELTGRLDGYELVELLGRGGMGSVYLARQLSLDRLVALKTINPEWAGDPVFLSRFTREAYAAAQLTHHNVVQIHDIGEDRGTHFFSMEYVEGRSLAELLKAKGRLDVEEATGYILHAARGLRFAHDHDMVHRDIKPANLLLTDEGVVKVADLGLVKTAMPGPQADADDAGHGGGRSGGGRRGGHGGDAALTSQQAMGTPAYMAPEQIEDASHVDGRADIYSLGCTFYALTTGRPVFEGTTAEEVMTKHATEAVIPPEKIAKRVPASLSSIILNMVAKNPAERFASMKDLIDALERFLGITAGPFTPREEHVQTLEQAVQGFYASPRARLRQWLVLGFTLLCGAWGTWALLTARPSGVVAAAALWLFTGVSYATLTGITQKTAVARKVRQLVFGSRLRDWLAWTFMAVAVGVVLVLLNLHGLMLATLVAGAVLAAVFHFSIDWLVTRERQPHVQAVRQMLKQLRLRGLEEDAVRRFVCRYSGRHWEAFYEALFGYEAKLYARRHWGDDEEGRPRRRHGAWRDGLIQWIDQRQQRREEARRRRHLQKIETRRLQAEGRSEADATREAQTVASGLVSQAAQVRQASAAPGVSMAGGAAEGDGGRAGHSSAGRVTRLLLGGRARLAVGAALLAVYALWARQNGLMADLEAASGLRQARGVLNQERDLLRRPSWAEGLPELSALPGEVMQLLSSHGVGLAGVLLVLSTFHVGRRMTLLMLPAVVVLIAGPLLPVPDLWVLSPTELVLATGLALAAAGWWIGRSRRQRVRG